MNHQDDINNSQNAQNGGFIFNVANKPLPWFGLLALTVIFLAWQAGQAKQAAFDAVTASMLAEQHFKDYTKTTDEYVEKLRFELASHGIKTPEKSK